MLLMFKTENFLFSMMCAENWVSRDTLIAIGDTPINMELKTVGLKVEDEVYKILKKHNKLDQVIWGSAKYNHSMRLREIDPNVARFACLTELNIIFLCYMLGFSSFIQMTFDSIQIPQLTHGFISVKMKEMTNPFIRNLFFLYVKTILY